jgi:hypothetical protein
MTATGPQEMAWDEPGPEEMTVAVPYEAVLDLVDLLGAMARLCTAQPEALDAVIGASGCGGYDAAALAAAAAANAWLLAATAGLAGPCPEPAI